MIAALVGSPTRTNLLLVRAWWALGADARVLWPRETTTVLEEGDVALFRLDVLPTLDGVEPGLEVAHALARLGVRVLNRPAGLIGTHDKLVTAARLEEAAIPHPRTVHVVPGQPMPEIAMPFVLKPRFGSWGQDVSRCRTPAELDATLAAVADRPWWRRHGAIAQELVSRTRRDLRLVVAGGRVVAGAERVAAEGEWRTNVSLGGRILPADPPPEARELAVEAADAIGVDLVGVDLLPAEDGWVVLELNGAVDFDRGYTIDGTDPYAAILDCLSIGSTEEAVEASSAAYQPRRETGMTKTIEGKPARVGDEIVITGHSVGDSPRTAVILEILGDPGHERFRVRWEDGHESIFFPADDAVIRRPRRRQPAKP